MPTNRPANLLDADSIATSFGASALANVVVRGSSVVRGVVLAWMMSAEEFGLLGVALLVANVLMPIAGVGLHESIARYAPAHEVAGTLRRFAWRSLTAAVVTSCVFTAGLVLLAPVLAPVLLSAGQESPDESAPLGLMRIVLLCVVTLVPYHATLALMRGIRRFRGVAAVDSAATLAFTLFAVGCVALGWDSATHVIAAYALANVAGLASLLIFLRSHGSGESTVSPGQSVRAATVRERSSVRAGLSPARSSSATPHGLPEYGQSVPPGSSVPPESSTLVVAPGKPVLRPLFAYGVWAAGIASAWQLLSYYPTWHLLRVTDEGVVGAFYAVRMITQVLQIAGAMGVAIVAAHVTQRWEAEGAGRALPFLETLTKAGTVGLIVMGAGLAAAEPMVMKLLPTRLSAGAACYRPMLGFFLLFSITSLWAIRLSLIERPRLVFFAWLAGTVVGVAVCCSLLGSPFAAERVDPATALSAAAWAMMAGGATAASVLLVMLIRARTTPGATSIILALLGAALPLGGWPAALCGMLVLAAAFSTSLILSRDERRALRKMLPHRKAR